MTAGPPEEGDPSLHPPALVDPAHNLEQREDPKGARPKVGPRFGTQTIAEEAQGFQGGTDFYLPLIGQPKISEVRAWGAPVCTEQENPGIYIQANEWQVHGPFKSIFRSGANPEKVLRIRRGAMQVYHHNQ